MTPLSSGRMVGKYRLDRLLATGGMGSVWVATHVGLDAPVAIKFMAPELTSNADARMRFDREARAAGRLRTPHVVRVHDHGLEEDTPFIVMELLEGEDLAARLKREVRLGLVETARILEGAARGLQRAHELGIVHRDLKPGNIFLALGDDGETVKVLDFGIAKTPGLGRLGEDEATKSGLLLGSPEYMSPEQAVGSRAVDHRSDLWSLAVIAFRAITGEKPFAGSNVGEVIVKVCTGPLPSASGALGVPWPELDRFFARALAREPATRFQSARELADALAGVAARHAPVAEAATPPGVATTTPEATAPGTRRLPGGTPTGRDAAAAGAHDVARPRRRLRGVAWTLAIGGAVIAVVLGVSALRGNATPVPQEAAAESAPTPAAPAEVTGAVLVVPAPAAPEPAEDGPASEPAVPAASTPAAARPAQAARNAAAPPRPRSAPAPTASSPQPAPSAGAAPGKPSWGF